jgi:HEAT repeat protein
LEDALTVYLSGSSEISRLREIASAYPELAADALIRLIAVVEGDARDRLANLAFALSMVHRWCEDADSKNPQTRRRAFAGLEAVAHYEPVHRVAEAVLVRGLHDSDDQARLSAARALAYSASPRHVAEVFALALRENADNRLALAEALRPYAMSLSAGAVLAPRPEVLAALEIFESWECALRLDDVRPLAVHADPAVRLKTMSLLMHTPLTNENQSALLAGIADVDLKVRIAAARTAGEMKVVAAVPALNGCLQLGDEELKLAATKALHEIQSEADPEECLSPEPQARV